MVQRNEGNLLVRHLSSYQRMLRQKLRKVCIFQVNPIRNGEFEAVIKLSGKRTPAAIKGGFNCLTISESGCAYTYI